MSSNKIEQGLFEYLCEVLNNPVKYTLTHRDTNHTQYGFKINNDVFVVDFVLIHINNLTMYIVSFALYDTDDTITYELISNKKSALQVMATVITIIRNFITNVDYDFIICTAANEGSRVGVYSHMIQKLVSSKDFYMIKNQQHDTLFVLGRQPLSPKTRELITKLTDIDLGKN